MIVATLTILGPLGAAALALAVRRYSGFLALAGAAISVIAALTTLVRVNAGSRFETSFPGIPDYPLRLIADPQAALLLTVVAVVNLLVIIYAIGYMTGEADQPRFFAEMGLFAGAMQALVLAGDWILFLAAWEIIGLASYLLIGFWFERTGIPSAATRAFLVTRTADLGLYAGIAILVTGTGTTAIAGTLDITGGAALAATVVLLLAAMGKSAQAPFHGWLQAAMIGPTPVSAFLHSATLVVAGAILLTRVSPMLTADARLLIGLAGGITVVVAGLMALAQADLKRLLAASTSSQIGFMFLAIAAASPFAALFHLTTHAAMKSALFLGPGIFQHARHSTGFEALHGVARTHRRTYLAMAIAGLALVGVPPLAGFWSKEAIIAATFHSELNWLWGPLALVGTLLTGMYVARALRELLDGDGEDQPIHGLTWMTAGLAGLAILAVVIGLAGFWLTGFLGAEMPSSLLSLLLGTSVAIAGLLAGWLRPDASFWLRAVAARAADGFRVDSGFDGLVIRPVSALATGLNGLDRRIEALVHSIGRLVTQIEPQVQSEPALARIMEAVGSKTLLLGRLTALTDDVGISGLIGGLVRGVRNLGARSRQLQTGLIHRELLATAAGVLVILVLILAR